MFAFAICVSFLRVFIAVPRSQPCSCAKGRTDSDVVVERHEQGKLDQQLSRMTL